MPRWTNSATNQTAQVNLHQQDMYLKKTSDEITMSPEYFKSCKYGEPESVMYQTGSIGFLRSLDRNSEASYEMNSLLPLNSQQGSAIYYHICSCRISCLHQVQICLRNVVRCSHEPHRKLRILELLLLLLFGFPHLIPQLTFH